MSDTLATIEAAIADILLGKMVIMIDDESRENEGDLILAAEHATPEAINFMITHARGLVCLSLMEEDFMRLRIPMMVKHNNAPRETAFGVSIEARDGVTTGISAHDRSHTIKTAMNDDSTALDIVMPGHIFPLCAKAGGVFTRNGHTEGSVDLARLAGLKPAAVICEIMNADGSMARLPDLIQFAALHDLKIISIRDLQTYRACQEQLVTQQADATLPIEGLGEFKIQTFMSHVDQHEYVVLSKPIVDTALPPMVRLHSACLTGDIFGSKRCDCGEQLELSMQLIAEHGGHVIYLPQEGRGIGLSNKIKAYALQDQGLDTVEANNKLGFADDLRDYGVAAQILRELGVMALRLLTNNPRKVTGLQRYGLDVSERIPLEAEVTKTNVRYMQTKRDKLGHWIKTSLEEIL